MTQTNSPKIKKLLQKCRHNCISELLNTKLEGRKTIDRFKNNLIYYIYDGYGWSNGMTEETRIRKMEEDFGSLTLPLLDHSSLGYCIKSMRNKTELLQERHTKSIVDISNLFLLEIGLNLNEKVLASAVRADLKDLKMLNIIHLGVVASRVSTKNKNYFNSSKLDDFGKTELDYYSDLVNSLIKKKIENSSRKPEEKRPTIESFYPYIQILSVLGGQKKHLQSLFELIFSSFPEKQLTDDIISDVNLNKINKQEVVENFMNYAAEKIEKIIQNHDRNKPLSQKETQELSYEIIDYHTILYNLDYQITPKTFVVSTVNSHDVKQTRVNIVADFSSSYKSAQTTARI